MGFLTPLLFPSHCATKGAGPFTPQDRHQLTRLPTPLPGAHPRTNILAGTAYLKAMQDRFGYPALFAAYNSGPGRYEDHLRTGKPLPAETRDYVDQLAPALGVAMQSVDAAAAPPLPPDWREAPLFVPRSNDRRSAADRTTEMPSARSSASVPVRQDADDSSDPKTMSVVQNTPRGAR